MDLSSALRVFFSARGSSIKQIPLVFVYGTEIQAMVLTKLRVDDGATYFDLDYFFPPFPNGNAEVHGLGLCSLFEQSLFKYCFYNTHLPDLCLPLHDRSFNRDVQTLVVREEQGSLRVKAYLDSIVLKDFAFEMIVCL